MSRAVRAALLGNDLCALCMAHLRMLFNAARQFDGPATLVWQRLASGCRSKPQPPQFPNCLSKTGKNCNIHAPICQFLPDCAIRCLFCNRVLWPIRRVMRASATAVTRVTRTPVSSRIHRRPIGQFLASSCCKAVHPRIPWRPFASGVRAYLVPSLRIPFRKRC